MVPRRWAAIIPYMPSVNPNLPGSTKGNNDKNLISSFLKIQSPRLGKSQ